MKENKNIDRESLYSLRLKDGSTVIARIFKNSVTEESVWFTQDRMIFECEVYYSERYDVGDDVSIFKSCF